MRLPRPPRLNAFTLLELLVALVVTALLIGMGYAALRLVQGQQRAIQHKASLLGQLSTWQTLLAADFASGRPIEATETEIRCLRPMGPVVYYWLDSTLVRTQGEVTDTFPGPIREYAYFWQGQPRRQGLIDEIALTTVLAQDTFYLQARASYAAQALLSSLASPIP
jgi:prepilin-type N-terminal cleavage/methylation domain-containing protein